MPTLSITVKGVSVSATITDAQYAKLGVDRAVEMATLQPGPGQDADTPMEQRPNWCADVSSYVAWVIDRSGLDPQEAFSRIISNATPPEEWTPPPDVVLTGEALKASLRAYAAEKRWNVETGGCIDPNGNAIATDRDSQTKLIAEMLAITTNMRTDPSPWKLRGNGFVMLTNTQMLQAITAARTHIANAFGGEAIALAGIEAGTITDKAGVNAVAWPSNN